MSISISNLSKSFDSGKITAFENVNIEVSQGELFGLIGPDGAGKTTLFRVLTTLLLPDKGDAKVCGYDIVEEYKQIRKTSGYMPGKFSLYQDLSIEENLNFFAKVFNTSVVKNRHLIEDIYVQIEKYKDRPAGKLSGGMKQKLALCCALIHEPKILFLDEPTTGVDPVSRREFWDMLDRLKARNITIFVSTPYMDEAGRCDRVGLMQNGKIMSVNTLEGILQQYENRVYAMKGSRLYEVSKHLQNYPGLISCYPFGQSLHLTFPSNENTDLVVAYCKRYGFDNLTITPILPDIEDVFMNLMKKVG